MSPLRSGETGTERRCNSERYSYNPSSSYRGKCDQLSHLQVGVIGQKVCVTNPNKLENL